MKKISTLSIKGSIKGLDSFFDNPLMSRLRVDDTLIVNGFSWRVSRVDFIGDENMELLLKGLAEA